jgi:predicted nucleic acid-binding protein
LAQKDPHAQVSALIFDTDILVWVHRGHLGAAEFVNRVAADERNFSPISYLEVLYGARDAGDLRKIQRMMTDLFTEAVPLNERICALAIRIMESFVLAHRLDASDALIAATALERQETLATANRKHFNFIPGLRLRVFRP